MRYARWGAAVLGAALAVRVVRSRHRRFLHPVGRSFSGEWEGFDRGGIAGLDARHPATIRVSKGVGRRGSRADVLGLAVRVHLPGRDLDLLLSSSGRGLVTRHLPVPRRGFDVPYGSITAYRTGDGAKAYVVGRTDPAGPALGPTLETLGERDRVLLGLRSGGRERTIARVRFGHPLDPAADAALAFDPVRNALPGLYPGGLVHGTRAAAYRWSQRWRGARPVPGNPAAVARTAGAPPI